MTSEDNADLARDLERKRALAEAGVNDPLTNAATTFNPITFALGVTGALAALVAALYALATRKRRPRSDD